MQVFISTNLIDYNSLQLVKPVKVIKNQSDKKSLSFKNLRKSNDPVHSPNKTLKVHCV